MGYGGLEDEARRTVAERIRALQHKLVKPVKPVAGCKMRRDHNIPILVREYIPAESHCQI